MERINIKPLSLNNAYSGRRFSTPELKRFKEALGYLLPKKTLSRGVYRVICEFGVSSKASDLDNLCKTFLDGLSEKYGFNDKLIYRLEVEKKDVEKGKEYIAFEIVVNTSPFTA